MVFLVACLTYDQLGTSVKATGESHLNTGRDISRTFDVQVVIHGQRLAKYHFRGRTYVEALAGAEYELVIKNPLRERVAVALSVDGLNSIDARRTSAWQASKWVIGPYQTIRVMGWQMSSARARRFYFTSEHDSYAANLGQASNIGVISAVFFRERGSTQIPIVPAPRSGRRTERDTGSDNRAESRSNTPQAQRVERDKSGVITPEDYAATGIGRSVHYDVRWISMELEPRAAAEVTIRYEFYAGLVRLGIKPRKDGHAAPLIRREQATGFEGRSFSPEP